MGGIRNVVTPLNGCTNYPGVNTNGNFGLYELLWRLDVMEKWFDLDFDHSGTIFNGCSVLSLHDNYRY